MVNNIPTNPPYPRVQSVGIVVFNTNKVLIVSHGKSSHHFEGVLGLPAGKIDPGETAIQAAIRELQEETGLITTIAHMSPLSHTYQATIVQKDGTYIFDWYVFLCKKYIGSLKATEETTPKWIEIEKLESMELLPNVKEAIKDAKELL